MLAILRFSEGGQGRRGRGTQRRWLCSMFSNSAMCALLLYLYISTSCILCTICAFWSLFSYHSVEPPTQFLYKILKFFIFLNLFCSNIVLRAYIRIYVSGDGGRWVAVRGRDWNCTSLDDKNERLFFSFFCIFSSIFRLIIISKILWYQLLTVFAYNSVCYYMWIDSVFRL